MRVRSMVWAYSSVVEHYVDIVGVPSSNLGTPTIEPKTRLMAGFLCLYVASEQGRQITSDQFRSAGNMRRIMRFQPRLVSIRYRFGPVAQF